MNQKSVLIIDDEPDICFLLKSILVHLGYSVETATSLRSGMEIFNKSKPATVFLDMNLPDGLGISIMPNLKETESVNPEIIVISAFDGLVKKALEQGAYTFISKPFTSETIKKIMDQLEKGTNQEKKTNIAYSKEH